MLQWCSGDAVRGWSVGFFLRPGADVYSGLLIVGGYGSIYGMQRSCGAEVGFSFSAGSRRGVFSFHNLISTVGCGNLEELEDSGIIQVFENE